MTSPAASTSTFIFRKVSRFPWLLLLGVFVIPEVTWGQPATPSDIRTWGLTLSRTKISWKDNANDETAYHIERKTNAGDFVEIGTVGADTGGYEDASVDPMNSYLYRVRAFRMGDGMFSNYSNQAAGPLNLTGTNFRVFYNTTNCPPFDGGQINCVPAGTNGMGQNEYAARMLSISEGCRTEYANFMFLPGYNPVSPDSFPFNLKWCDGGGCANGCGFGLAPQYLAPYNHTTNTGDPASLLIPVHELFHMVQFAYNAIQTDPDGNWVIEGQARAIQDLACVQIGGVCQNVDDDPNGVANYVGEVNGYLGNPNRPITHLSYGTALFWVYMCDQYGNNLAEPQKGLDFYEEFWDEANDDVMRDGIQVMDQTLANLGETDRYVDAFKNFVIANYAKQMTGPSIPSKYKYTDETQTPGPYNNVALSVSEDLAPLDQVGPLLSDVREWAARYHEFRPEASVPFIQIDYSVDSPSPAYFVLLLIKGNDIVMEERHVGLDFERSIANDSYDKVVVIIAGLDQLVNFRYVINGTQPVLHILDPLTGRKASVGDRNAPEKFLAKVEVLSPMGDPVTGIMPSAFTFKVGNTTLGAGNIVTNAYVQGQYWFVIQAPTQTANTDYNLNVRWSILSATETNAIRYQPRADADNVLVIDRSGSMGAPPSKIADAKDAANLYVDSWREGDKVGVVSFDCAPAAVNLTLRDWDTTSRTDAHTAINALLAGGGTAIGDGLSTGLSQLTSLANPMHQWALILLSDGENTCDMTIQNFRDAYQARVDAGQQVPQVHTIAIGADANRPDLQALAQACGGTYLFAAEPGPKSEGQKGLGIDEFFLNLAEIYRIVGTEVAGQNEVLSARGVTARELPNIHTFYVDAGASELVAAVRWRFGNPLILLRDPIGGVHTIPFTEIADHHKVFRIGAPIPGMWQFELIINPAGGCQEFCESYYLVEASVKSILTMELYLALPLEERIVGTPMPILVSLTDTGPIKNATVRALVTNPNGVETPRTLYDDGAHGDGGPDDGIYGNKYYGTGLEGTYQVVATAEGTSDTLGQFTRRRTKAFHMQGGKDSDDDRMPDEYEVLFPCLNPGENDAKADKDQDGLDNITEFQIGTNPCDPDTDDGGESDGSEVRRQADPFEPRDDRSKPPRIRVIPGVLKILVRFNTPFIGRDIPSPDKFDIYRCDPGSDEFNLIFPEWPAEPPFQFVDESIQEGLNYKYRIVARGANSEESCPSNVEDATGTRDPYPPHGSIFINMGAMTTSSLDVELTLIAEDNFEPEFDLDPRDAHDPMAEVSGVADMMVMNHSDGSDGVWEPFNPTRPWVIEPNAMGIATVFVKYRDNAGNVSAMYHATITVVEAPTPTETDIEPTATETPEPTETESPVPTETETETPAETPTPTCNVQDSDFDFDGMNGVDARDLLLCLAGIQQGSPFRDFNCDGKMDMEDLFLMARKWKIELP